MNRVIALLIALASTASAQTLEVDNSRTKEFGATGTILVPTVVMNLSVHGSLFQVKQGGGGSAQAKAKFDVIGLDKAMVQATAKKVQDDLVARLKAAGYTVLTYDDIKDDPELAGKDRLEIDERFGLPYKKDASTIDYVVATPSDAQAFKTGMRGYPGVFGKIMKAKNAVVVVPELWIASPQLSGETSRGYKSVSAKVNVAPGMTLGGAFVYVNTPKGGWGSVKLKNYSNIADNVGALLLDKDEKSDFGEKPDWMGRVSGYGAGAITRKTGVYSFVAHPDQYPAALLAAGTALNQQIEAAAKEAKK